MKTFILIALPLFVHFNSYSQYGEPDPNFDGDGILVLNINDYSSNAMAIKALADNKILIAGNAYNGADEDFALICLYPDGSLDNSFGTNGLVLTDISSNNDLATCMQIQADGKIVVGGTANNGNSFAVVRYNSDGSPDSSFSSDGIVTPAVGMRNDAGPDLLIQEDGKIIIAGSDARNASYYCSMVRYNTNGTIDNTFMPDDTAFEALINGAALQSDGKILVTGQVSSMSEIDLAVARFNSDGSIDTSFSFDGKLSYDYQVYDVGMGVSVQDDQKIIVTGYIFGAFYGLLVLRYNPDGILDESFADNGVYTYPDPEYDSHVANAVIIQPDNKIVTGGWGAITSSETGAELFRLNEDGIPDTTFGAGGFFHSYETGSISMNGLDIQSDGKILACGYSILENNYSMSAMRLTSGLAPLITESYPVYADLVVYPNPFSGILNLDIPETQKSSLLKIFTMDGRVVYISEVTEKQESMNLSFLNKGSYLVRILNPDWTISKLIVKY